MPVQALPKYSFTLHFETGRSSKLLLFKNLLKNDNLLLFSIWYFCPIVERKVISETSKFSALKQLVTEVKHVGRESFVFWRNKTAVARSRCEGEFLSLNVRKWHGMEKVPSRKIYNFCRSLNITGTNTWAAHVERGIDMQGYKIQKIDTKICCRHTWMGESILRTWAWVRR